MKYIVPSPELDIDLTENLDNIGKVIDDLNHRRDQGLSAELEANLKKQLLISQVYHSNAIEGNTLTIRETELILDGMVINERPLKDEIEAKSLAKATDYLYKLIDGREALTKRTLLELHGLIMKDIPSIDHGCFRKQEVKIKESDHVPPHFNDVEPYVDEMFQWMNRNNHKYDPLLMGAILHHWLTWIHPFSDGNGRVSRLFLNFFLLQKGYPEVVIKISTRDGYYNALIEADKGNISPMVELLTDTIRDSISIYEELVNEDERQKSWKSKYKEISQSQYQKAKETHSFQYEVWKNQISVFKALLAENLREINDYLPNLTFNIKEYEPLNFSQYLDILEDRKVSNTWYINLGVYDKSRHEGMGFIFFFERFKYSKPLSILGADGVDKRTGKRINWESKPQIKLYVTARDKGISQKLKPQIDLMNIGTWDDQLSFGVKNRAWRRNQKNEKANVITVKENPGKVVRNFIDQILLHYFDIGKK
ncbi:MAG: Fic family protein [Cyclobacteriaceae bacterium]